MGIFDFFKRKKSSNNNNDNFLIENLIFPGVKGVDFNSVKTKSSNIQKSLANDINGNWYYSQSPIICLMRSVSQSNFKDELNKLLIANNLKYLDHSTRNNIMFWDFEVENIKVRDMENDTFNFSIEAQTSNEISMIVHRILHIFS